MAMSRPIPESSVTNQRGPVVGALTAVFTLRRVQTANTGHREEKRSNVVSHIQ
jgi:hypothetical protein